VKNTHLQNNKSVYDNIVAEMEVEHKSLVKYY